MALSGAYCISIELSKCLGIYQLCEGVVYFGKWMALSEDTLVERFEVNISLLHLTALMATTILAHEGIGASTQDITPVASIC